jgi:hypothetical protein
MRNSKLLLLAALAAGSLAVMPAMAQVNNDSATPKFSGTAPEQTTPPADAPVVASPPTLSSGATIGGVPESAKAHTPQQEAAGSGGGSGGGK